MIPMWIFTGISAFLLASCAAFFSITGLAALYAAAFMPVVIMAVAIECGKISATFWLHRSAKKVSKLWTGLIAAAILGSMIVTSGGVYGFLTKGHLEQISPISDISLRVERIGNRINTETNIINRSQVRLDQLDGVIDTLIEYDKISGPTGATAVRKSQREERVEIQESIDFSYVRIDELRDQRLPLNRKVATVEAKLGPVKYLAALFNAGTDKTVQWFTFMIVVLLDPFAILMVIATSIGYDDWVKRRGFPRGTKIVEVEKIVEKIIEVPVEVEKIVEKIIEVEKIVEKEVINIVSEVVREEVPLTMETLTEFLENPDMQQELVDNPELIEEVEKMLSRIKDTEDRNKDSAWISKDDKPMEFSKGKKK